MQRVFDEDKDETQNNIHFTETNTTMYIPR